VSAFPHVEEVGWSPLLVGEAKRVPTNKTTSKSSKAQKATTKKTTVKKAASSKPTAKTGTSKKVTRKAATTKTPQGAPGRSRAPSGRTSPGAVPARPGDTIVIDSAQVGSPAREGEVVKVTVGEFSVRYQVRWGDGHETIISPSAGTARIIRT
jgi:hypothetical protein